MLKMYTEYSKENIAPQSIPLKRFGYLDLKKDHRTAPPQENLRPKKKCRTFLSLNSYIYNTSITKITMNMVKYTKN